MNHDEQCSCSSPTSLADLCDVCRAAWAGWVEENLLDLTELNAPARRELRRMQAQEAA